MADAARIGGKQVTIECEHAAPIVYKNLPRGVMWMGVIQVVGGGILLIIGIASFVTGTFVGMIGTNLVFVTVLAGAFGIAAGKNKGACEITTSMIFSIIAAISSFGVLIVAIQTMVALASLPSHYRPSSSMGICVVLVLIALAEAIVSVVLSAIACHFSCFCCKRCCCKYDITTTETIIISNVQQEQQLQLLGSPPHGAQVQQPPLYSKYDVV